MPVLGHSHSEGSEGAACAPLCAPGPATGHHQEEPGSIHSSCLLQLFTDTDKSPLSLFSKESPLITFVTLCEILPVALQLSLPKSTIPQWDTPPSETTILSILYQAVIYLVIKTWNNISL